MYNRKRPNKVLNLLLKSLLAGQESANYRIYSIKPHGVYLIFVLFGSGLIRGQGLFEARAFALQMRWQILSSNDSLFSNLH